MSSSERLSSERPARLLSLELFVLSLISLFFELLIIRWFTCEFNSFLVFKNFPLVACFVGLGVGVSLGRDYFKYSPYALCLSTFCVYLMIAIGFAPKVFPAAGLYQWLATGAVSEMMHAMTPEIVLLIVLMMFGVLVLLAGVFGFMVCLGSRIGILFDKHKPLQAYSIDIAGAIVGSIFFAITSFLCLTPAMQIAIVCVLLLICLHRQAKIWNTVSALLVSGVLAYLAVATSTNSPSFAWTPYYRLDYGEIPLDSRYVRAQQLDAKSPIIISVNHAIMQLFFPAELIFSSEAGANEEYCKLQNLVKVRRQYYTLPYKFKQSPKDVLILGAGTGSDVAYALKYGAERVDAVEIDSQVLRLGQKYNDTYHSSKVHLYCDDARAFIDHCRKKYDLVIFGCLDSLGLVGLSSIRTDSYIHTVDSYKHCLSLLKPDGLFIISFGSTGGGAGHWLRDKFYLTLREAAGYIPLVLSDERAPQKWPAYVFVSGTPVKEGRLQAPQSSESFSGIAMPDTVQARIMTDDWPYLYVKPISVDISYMIVLATIVCLAVWCGRGLLFARNNLLSDWQLFFLGAAFMLLELQAIARLSLCFGNTWVTASIVINGVLVMILCANYISTKFALARRQGLLYLGLIGSLLVSWFLPIHAIIAASIGNSLLSNFVVTFFTLLPILMAALVFAAAYAGVPIPSRAFAFNLLGSVGGGLFEYVSTYTGVNSLVLFAAAFYVCSYFFYIRGLLRGRVGVRSSTA